MEDIVGEVYQDPDSDWFLGVTTITANHIDHHIADLSDLVSFQSVNRSPHICNHKILYGLKAGQKWALPRGDLVD